MCTLSVLIVLSTCDIVLFFVSVCGLCEWDEQGNVDRVMNCGVHY